MMMVAQAKEIFVSFTGSRCNTGSLPINVAASFGQASAFPPSTDVDVAPEASNGAHGVESSVQAISSVPSSFLTTQQLPRPNPCPTLFAGFY